MPFPQTMLSHAPIPASVQMALASRSSGDRAALASNPFLDDAAFARLYTRSTSVRQAGRMLWRTTLTPAQAQHVARLETRPGVLNVLVNTTVGLQALSQVAAAGQLPAMSPTAAMLLMRRGDATVGGAVAGQLALPDAALWLMRRWHDVDLDHAVATMAASSLVKVSRRSWTPIELGAVVHERGALAAAVLATASRWPEHTCRVARSVDLHDPETVRMHGSADAAAQALLDHIDTVTGSGARTSAWQALLDRADVPTAARRAAHQRLAAAGQGTPDPAVPLDMQVDWRRDALTETQVATLWKAMDASPGRATLLWQAVSALRNPSLTGARRELLADVVTEQATPRVFGGCADDVCTLASEPGTTYVLRPDLNWSPGGHAVAPVKAVREKFGGRAKPGLLLDFDAVAGMPVPSTTMSQARTVGELATHTFGDDLECWTTMLEIGRTWTASVAELLDTAQLLAAAQAA